jgi:hypothetical protein
VTDRATVIETAISGIVARHGVNGWHAVLFHFSAKNFPARSEFDVRPPAEGSAQKKRFGGSGSSGGTIEQRGLRCAGKRGLMAL